MQQLKVYHKESNVLLTLEIGDLYSTEYIEALKKHLLNLMSEAYYNAYHDPSKADLFNKFSGNLITGIILCQTLKKIK